MRRRGERWGERRGEMRGKRQREKEKGGIGSTSTSPKAPNKAINSSHLI